MLRIRSYLDRPQLNSDVRQVIEMYALYRKTRTNDVSHYVFGSPTHVFGCNNGEVPKLLQKRLVPGDSQPYQWHLPVAEMLAESGEALVIDLKPNSRDQAHDLSLYELLDVWGVSADFWTPAMLRLRGLCVDGMPETPNRIEFERKDAECTEPIYSFVYLAGTVLNGKLSGKWTAPRASSTNSTLLWPPTLRYFISQIEMVTPEVLHPTRA